MISLFLGYLLVTLMILLLLKKKFGGRPPSLYKMSTFNDFLNSCNLFDLGFSGPLFTWTNNREHGKTIRTRIHRCHANLPWLNLFPNSNVTHLPRTHSDHCPLLLNILKKKPF